MLRMPFLVSLLKAGRRRNRIFVLLALVAASVALPARIHAQGQAQKINFPAPNQPNGFGNLVGLSLYLDATATSGLPVTYKVINGPATISGNVVTYTGLGQVIIEADQPGDGQNWAPAQPVRKTVTTQYLTGFGPSSSVESTVLTFSAAGQLGTEPAFFSYEQGFDPNGYGSFQPTTIDWANGSAPYSAYCQWNVTYAVGQTCILNFFFTPTTPGLHRGEMGLVDANGNVLAEQDVLGMGVAPMITFSKPLPAPLSMGRAFVAPQQPTFANGVLWVPDAAGNWMQAIGPKPIATSLGYEYSGNFSSPEAVAIDGLGNVFVADTGNHELKEIVAINGAPSAQVVVINTGLGGTFSPSALTFDGFGNLFVADTVNHSVYEVLAAPNGLIGTNPTVNLLSAAFTAPVALAYFADANTTAVDLYVLDAASGDVRILSGAGLTTPGTIAEGFAGAQGIAVDCNGDIFVANTPKGEIDELYAVDGEVSAEESPGVFWKSTNGIKPGGLTMDPNGNLYFSAPGVPAGAYELDVSDPPTLTFEATPVGTVSPDSPKSVTFTNSGNSLMNVTPPVGNPTNPYATTGFTVGAGVGCPVLTPGDTVVDAMFPGASCTENVSFTPVVQGPATGQLITQNTSPEQDPLIVPLNGGDATATQLVVTAPASAAPGQAFMFTVTAENAENQPLPNYAGTITFSSTDTAGVLPTGSVQLTNGTGNFQAVLNTPGTQTITATDAADNLTGVSGPIQVGDKSQTITFPTPGESYAGTSVILNASDSNAQPITYTATGPAVVSNNVLTYTGVGTVTVTATAAAGGGYDATAQTITIQTTLLAEPVGTQSGFVPTVVVFTQAGTLATMTLSTQGASPGDFQIASVADPPADICVEGRSYHAGDTCMVSFAFQPEKPGLRFGAITLSDFSGNVLATSYVYGSGTGPQLVYLPAMQQTVASGFTDATGVATDGNGNVFISDSASTTGIYEVPAGGGGKTLIADIDHADDVTVDGAGNVFAVSLTSVYEIQAVNGVVSSSSPVIELATGFSELDGIAVDGNGNVFVANAPVAGAEYAVGSVYELVAVNGSVPANSTPLLLTSTFPGGEVSLTGVAVDVAGNVYFSDQEQDKVFEIEAVNGTIPPSPTVAVVASFTTPSNVTIDPVGNLYVTDAGAHQLIKILATNGVVPVPAPASDMVTIGTGLGEPQGASVDAGGNVYIADNGLNAAISVRYGAPPTLTFASTVVGLTSKDSPQTVTVMNNGNAPLMYEAAASITPGFTLDSASSCPGSGSVPLSTPLAAGASCTDVVSFTPVAAGQDDGALVSTDDNLNVPNATQTVPLIAVGIAPTLKLTLTASPAAVFLLNPVALTATASSNSATPAGTVSFYDGGTLIGTATLGGGGQAGTSMGTLTLSTLALGPHTITASYTSTTLGAVSSSPVTVLVEDFSLTFAQPTVTIPHGGTATFTFTVAPIGGATMPAAIALVDAGEPQSSTETWSTQTVAAGSGATVVTLTIHTPDYPTGPFSQLMQGRSGLTFAMLGLVLLPFGRSQRRRSRAARVLRCALLVVLAALGSATISGCGSGWKTQTFSVSVTGSSGPLSHTATASLVSK